MRFSFIIAVLPLVISAPAVAGPVGDAAKKGDIAEVERLLASGEDVNEPDGMASPLHWAAMNGHADVVKLLAAEGADLDAQSSMLGTPIHAAARFDRAQAVQELLSAGADPDARDKDEFTPLMRAILENRASAVEALLSGGANIDAVGIAPGSAAVGKGPTVALHLALRLERGEIAELLRAAGAGPIPPDVPADILAGGDPERGRELVYKRCVSCHTIAAGDPPPTSDERIWGPPLIDLIGRPVADFGGFEYTDALGAFGGNWTPERLFQFTWRPMLTAPGTKMSWPPELSQEEVADVAAYFVSTAN